MNFNDLLRTARPSIELTYTSRLTVLTAVSYIKPNGADGTRWVEETTNVLCRLSRDKRVNTSQTEGNLNTNQHLLFCAPEISIPAGSRLMIDGEKYERTQEPMVYPSHQEVTVTKHEWA